MRNIFIWASNEEMAAQYSFPSEFSITNTDGTTGGLSVLLTQPLAFNYIQMPSRLVSYEQIQYYPFPCPDISRRLLFLY